MMVRENTPTRARPANAAATDRLEALAAIWARQTGRSIVINDASAASARPAASRSNA